MDHVSRTDRTAEYSNVVVLLHRSVGIFPVKIFSGEPTELIEHGFDFLLAHVR